MSNQESKFGSKPEIKNWLNETIREYISKGYARKLSEEEIAEWEKEIYYLPHFIVFNKNKTPFKPRLVFDAAAKNKGISINSMLLSGPDATTSSFGVTTRFREGKYAIAGDILLPSKNKRRRSEETMLSFPRLRHKQKTRRIHTASDDIWINLLTSMCSGSKKS